jgi:hypothetical protein
MFEGESLRAKALSPFIKTRRKQVGKKKSPKKAASATIVLNARTCACVHVCMCACAHVRTCAFQGRIRGGVGEPDS